MGEVFAGRYELADPIGRGGVGAVWRAWDHRRRRYVAAKVLLQSDAHSLLRFVREQALRIDHPHVLAPASWAADDDKVLFTMDLVAGGSLVHLIGDYGPLPPAFVCTLLDQLLAGLAAVHAEGVVHRDIKPANILLEATGTRRPRLRLSDFGIAMRLGEPRLTETNLVVGTPGYLAPEQMMGAEPDFPADLFAVGLVALYLLEGAKPDAKALIQYFAAHGTPGAPQSVPEPLWQVVATLLQPDPQARFRTATGARKALAAARELLTEPGADDESIEIFDQLGPLPPGFGPEGPLKPAPGVDPSRTRHGGTGASGETRFRTGDGSGPPSGSSEGSGVPSGSGGASGMPSGVGGQSATPPGVGGGSADFDARGEHGGSSWPGYEAGADAGSSAGAGAGPGHAGGMPPWPDEGNRLAPRTGEAGGASSWFGEGSGRHSQAREPSEAPSHPGGAHRVPPRPGEGNGESRPGEGNGPSWPGTGNEVSRPPGTGNDESWQAAGNAAARPGEGGPQSWPGETSSPSWPGQASPPPWSEQADPPSWPAGTSLPPSPGAAPFGPGANAPSAPSGSNASSPTTDPGTDSRTPWATHHTPPAPARPPSTSDTGSFHLPPPQSQSPSQPSVPPEHEQQPYQHRPQAQAHSAYASPHDPTPPTHVLPSPQPHAPRFPTQAQKPIPHQPRADASTASYTAQSPQVPPSARAISRARRSGPPAKVAIPLLILALACYAVGFWALTQI
ncbi:protein kinase [Streptomyces sp. NBC_00285]|uniref:serine/threonine-protein kinase n=1 Tax=Streptomyces sp. NBC_00285 TaxID=2975700 RepID=UPI002E2E30A7|nr:protein kinase [Streptomyces sp. NBC_00285]